LAFAPFDTILALFFCLLAAACMMAGTDREIAEWVIRHGGRVMLDGARTPIDDLSQLLQREFRRAPA
jgi:hypothetical protein